ncbi:MAG TPA: GDP-L-fucose synthase [Candidatus Polarisedimenticolaceae bacterium]|nr:GDP-L-fucose synthase [Candidatus Polarisedimenticolaceae bacterium]
MDRASRIFVAGHRGMVGSAVVRLLRQSGYTGILTRTRDELDLLDQRRVRRFFRELQPRYVVLAAARVGGIQANNDFQADFLYENLVIQTNVIGAAVDEGSDKLLFLGSSCIYPRMATQPIDEAALLTGPLEPTNEGYAIAKIAGMKLCEKIVLQHGRRFVSAMPTNLYGPGDDYRSDQAHVIPMLLRRIHRAKATGAPTVTIWGSGSPLREFLHVDDLARALLLMLERYEEPTHVNIGSGEEISIRELAALIAETVGYRGELVWDRSKPDGTPRKLLDSSRIRALGWSPRIGLRDGLASTYREALAALD